MHIQNHQNSNSSNSLKYLFSHLSDSLSIEEASAFLELSNQEFIKVLNDGNININKFFKILEKCHLSYANFLSAKIDVECVVATLKNKKMNPSRYTNSNYSSLMISDSILENCPLKVQKEAIKFLQINTDLFKENKLVTKVSTILNSDLLHFLSTFYQYTPSDIVNLGKASGHYNNKLPFGRSFNGLDLKNSFSKVIEEISKHFETSFTYELVSLNSEKAIIRKNLSEKMKDELRTEIYSNENLCQYIQGSFSAISYYTTGLFAHTTEEKCLYRGDSTCEFHVHFNYLKPISLPAANAGLLH